MLSFFNHKEREKGEKKRTEKNMAAEKAGGIEKDKKRGRREKTSDHRKEKENRREKKRCRETKEKKKKRKKDRRWRGDYIDIYDTQPKSPLPRTRGGTRRAAWQTDRNRMGE